MIEIEAAIYFSLSNILNAEIRRSQIEAVNHFSNDETQYADLPTGKAGIRRSQ